VLGLGQLVLVASLGAKLLYDRATSPRVWVRTAPVDPELLIRGRYVELRLTARKSREPLPAWGNVALRVEKDALVATPDAYATRPLGRSPVSMQAEAGDGSVVLAPPVLFFIPEHAPDPTRLALDHELWVEVTVPSRGPPRPLRLGVKKNGSARITPL
jgi:hypothetical protein